MISILIALGFFGMIVFILSYQLVLSMGRLHQAVRLPLALVVTAVFVLGALVMVLNPPEPQAIFVQSR